MIADEEDFAFLGLPSPIEMWRQHALLLTDEVPELNRQLFMARRNMEKLVSMHAQAQAEREDARNQLKLERDRVSALNQEITSYNYKMMALERKNQQLTLENEVLLSELLPASARVFRP